MDPNTNRFHPVREASFEETQLLLTEVGPKGATPLVTADEDPPRIAGPEWPIFEIGKEITFHGYVWRVLGFRGSRMVLEGIRPTKRAAKRALRGGSR